MRNQLIDHYRFRASEKRKLDALKFDAGDGGMSTVSEEQRRLCACFESLLPSLKSEYAELIRRVDLGGEDPATLAHELGISYNNLSVRLHRARNSLRSSLEKTCGICTRHGCLDCTCRLSEALSSGPGSGVEPDAV